MRNYPATDGADFGFHDTLFSTGAIHFFAIMKVATRARAGLVAQERRSKMLYRLPSSRLARRHLFRHAIAVSMLHDLGRRVAEWRRIRGDIGRLARLDDRLLADLGVKREEIAARVRGDY